MNSRELNKAGGVSVWSIIGCFIVLVVIAAVLFPILAHPTGCYSGNANCQSHMSQIGRALKLYLSEWHDMYPTNRNWAGKDSLGPISCYVKLTPPKPENKTTEKPERYRYGVNWVEALYPYLEAVSGGRSSAWTCPVVTGNKTLDDSSTARATYVMNRNLIEKPEKVIRSASSLMLVREMDRLVDAELRPTNNSCGNPKMPPHEPYLTTDNENDTNGRLHGPGSNILFADGHVKGYSEKYLPKQRDITKAKSWDPVDKQWYNYCSKSPSITESMKRTIAITP